MIKENEMEKLVEEVSAEIREYRSQTKVARWDSRERATRIIARIGKAFRDGELDEVLGVVGRLSWPLDRDCASIVDWITALPEGDLALIALAKKDAT